MAKEKNITPKTAQVLRLVRAGTPWANRSKAGRSRHLGQLFDKGLIRPGLMPETWELTDEGFRALQIADQQRADRERRFRGTEGH